jgi:hypothetical protein
VWVRFKVGVAREFKNSARIRPSFPPPKDFDCFSAVLRLFLAGKYQQPPIKKRL